MTFFGRAPVPPKTETEQVIASPLSRFNPFRAHVYEAKRLPSPGTQNYAYENLGLVEFSPIGPTESNRKHIRPMQPAVAYAGLGVYMQGIGGLVQGTIYGYPLIAPAGSISEQING